MRRIVGAAFTSLDGVVQAPGGPTEDPTGGFEHGGWIAPLWDERVGEEIGTLFGRPFDLLLGWRTYDIFAGFWPFAADQEAEIRDPFNSCTKYVVTHRDGPLDWQNSVRVSSMEDLRKIKEGDGPDLVIQGSASLYPQLLEADLLDELTLMIFPVLLGRGKRLFDDGTPPRTLRAAGHTLTDKGTIVARYVPAGQVKTVAISPPSTSAREQARQAAMAEGRW